jgi:NADH-quinone oxidoreductase subunit I
MRIDKTAASYLLLELLRGMATTLRYMFKQKATLNYPYEKSPESPRLPRDNQGENPRQSG